MSLLVFVHELGHFWTARRFGVRTEEFGFGLPPRMFGLYKVNGKWQTVWGKKEVIAPETIYSINWLPIGGFVKIKGENGEAANDSDSFGAKKAWQKIIILAAGSLMNLFLCWGLLTIGYVIGLPAVNVESGGQFVNQPEVQVTETIKDMPAETAGIIMGDTIVSIDNQEIKTSGDLKSYLADKKDVTVNVKIKREREILTKEVKVDEAAGQGAIGVAIVDVGLVRYPLHLAFVQAVKTSWYWTSMIASAVYALVKQLFGGVSAGVEFAGPVGIAVMTGQAAKMGWIYVLQFAALLSLNLGIINILPFPALDGGRIAFVLFSRARGKKEGGKWENLSHNVGFLLLITLIIFVTWKDLVKYGGTAFSFIKNLVGL